MTGNVEQVVRTLLRFVATVLVAGLGLAAIGVAAVPQIAKLATAYRGTAPDLPPLRTLAQTSYVYDATKQKIDTLFVEDRVPFTLDQVPKDVVAAVLATEDAGFYQHKGVNAKGILRAVMANVAAGGNSQGGSTITQQLVKNAIVGNKRDANRKILEAAYAVRLERQMSKDDILEQYLNTVYLGNNAYGLESAAQTYFGKDVQQLDLLEGAFLAGLIREPGGYDPIQRPERSRIRFKEVLRRLVSVGRLTEQDYKNLADTWKLPDTLKKQVTSAQKPTTYFTAEVRNFLLNKSDILGSTYQQRYNALFRGGLRIYTTLHPDLQAAAEQARNDPAQGGKLPDTNGRFDAAIVSLDTKTGAVVAMVGGRDFQKSEVNLALTPRQTGSSVKGFILTAALQAGIQNTDIIDGTLPCKWYYDDKKTPPFNINEGESLPTGPLDRMTWLSINCAFTRLYLSVGGKRVIQTAHNMGVKGDLKDIFAFATGGNEISPMDMAAGYSTLADNGNQHDPYLIDRIEGPDGQVIFQHDDAGKQVLDAAVAAKAVDILKGVIRQGTATRAKLDGNRPASGKTGTYELDKHAWFVGFTPQYTTAVYMGNPLDPNDPMRNVPEFKGVPRVQGGTYPAMIWKQYMDVAEKGLPVEDWPKPPGNKRQPLRIFAPDQDCFAKAAPTTTVAAGDPTAPPPAPDAGTTTSAPDFVPVKVKLPKFTDDPGDLTGPAATIQQGFFTYPCHGPLPTLPTTTTKPTTPGEPPAGSTPPSPPSPSSSAPKTSPPATKP